MPLTHSIGSTNLPLPRADEPFGMEYMPFGVTFRTQDAAYHAQLIGLKWRVRINWEGLSLAERNTCFAAFCAHLAASDTYTAPNGLTFTAYTTMSSWTESHWYQPNTNEVYYNVSFQFEEA